MGMAVTGWSGGYLLRAPIAGYLIQASSGSGKEILDLYPPAILYAGGVPLASAALVVVACMNFDMKILKRVSG